MTALGPTSQVPVAGFHTSALLLTPTSWLSTSLPLVPTTRPSARIVAFTHWRFVDIDCVRAVSGVDSPLMSTMIAPFELPPIWMMRPGRNIAALDVQEPNASITRSLRAAVPEDAIVIAGMTQIGYYSRPFWPVYRPRTYLTSSYSGNLGFEYPTALGAKVACPDRAVIAICGDGGFMYNAQEMSTAAKYGINVVAVVFNDEAFGNVSRDLDEAWGGSFSAELRNPDFMKLADAYGVAGLRAERPTDVGDLVRKALALERPALVEVPVGRMGRPAFFAPLKTLDKYRR